MKTDELRKKFLEFFESRKHKLYPSDSLVPTDDPTVLFTSAGMNQFKPMFMGKVRNVLRATSCQKCLRTDDLDKVGKTPSHHTFFEMLGNFSFGDYFKKEAITWAWEFVTDVLKISPDKLWISVYKDDPEAYDIWLNEIKISRERVLKFGEKENFWPSNVILNGPNGPCGPCSEIFFDQGQDVGCKEPGCSPACGCGRFIEVWNLVFTQFNRSQNDKGKGYIEPLHQKNIDTGMGLERMAAVLQGVRTNFEIDIFKPIVEEIEREIKNSKPENKTAIYTIADHIRAVVFAIGDGILPSNEERGYVVRKLIRKAAWYGRSLGLEDKFLYKLVPVVASVMKTAYPNLSTRRENISQIVLVEEERFQNTLEEGLNILNNLIGEVKEKKLNLISGEEAFKLYDTCGFPLELTELIAHDEGLDVDKAGFDLKMEEQRKKSKEKSKIAKEIFISDEISLKDEVKMRKFSPSEFVGYESLESQTKISDIAKNGQSVGEAGVGEEVEIILEQTPFYVEEGGQVADTGVIEGEDKKVEIDNTTRIEKFIIHHGKVVRGKIKTEERVLAKVDMERRLDIARNHTATHILQSALREVLGSHVEQAGSWVGPDSLRFDFTHFRAIDREQMERIEELVNSRIRGNDKVISRVMEKDEAQESGALAFFGEKYGDKVRVISVGEYSKEFCGGTHLDHTGQIGLFLIISESSVAQGVRRIGAVTGRAAYKKIRNLHSMFKDISGKYKISEDKIPGYIASSLERIKSLEKDLTNVKLENFRQLRAETLIKDSSRKENQLQGSRVISERFDEPVEILRRYMDIIKEKSGDDTFIFLYSAYEGKPFALIGITGDLVKDFDAVLAARKIGELILKNGSGGGRRDMAQTGSNLSVDTEKLESLKDLNVLSKIIEAAKS